MWLRFSFTIYNFYYISYSLCLSYLFDNRNMTDDEVPRSRTGRGLTRLKTMCVKINKGKKKYHCLLMSTLVWPLGRMQRILVVISE